jgi:hypothetical protein
MIQYVIWGEESQEQDLEVGESGSKLGSPWKHLKKRYVIFNWKMVLNVLFLVL